MYELNRSIDSNLDLWDNVQTDIAQLYRDLEANNENNALARTEAERDQCTEIAFHINETLAMIETRSEHMFA